MQEVRWVPLSMSHDIHSLSRVRENGTTSPVLEPGLGSYTVAHSDAIGPENGKTDPNADSQGAELIILKFLMPETRDWFYGFVQGWPSGESQKQGCWV